MTDVDAVWSAYWASEGAAGEVFVNSDGEKHPALTRHWQQVFATVKGVARVIDLASGAGSVFAALPDSHPFELHATDLSRKALVLLRDRITSAAAVVCSADRLPYTKGAFDLVVGQFGVEYAGIKAFAEAGRIVADGGRLSMLCHYEGGYINKRYRTELMGAELSRDCGFIDRAIEVTEACFSADRSRARAAEQRFMAVEPDVAKTVSAHPFGVHAHLYLGFRRLYERRNRYSVFDITNWLEQMRGELDRNIQRLTTMRAAALSERDMREVRSLLEGLGLTPVSYSLFKVSGHDLPVAWCLGAERRQQPARR